jgi:hypothetical protein
VISYHNLKKNCIELSQTSGSLYGVVITTYGLLITTPDFNSNNSQIYLKLLKNSPNLTQKFSQLLSYEFFQEKLIK